MSSCTRRSTVRRTASATLGAGLLGLALAAVPASAASAQVPLPTPSPSRSPDHMAVLTEVVDPVV